MQQATYLGSSVSREQKLLVSMRSTYSRPCTVSAPSLRIRIKHALAYGKEQCKLTQAKEWSQPLGQGIEHGLLHQL